MIAQPYIVGIMLFSIINGIFSPILLLIFAFVQILAPAFFLSDVRILFFLSSLILSTVTLIAGGIPAALYERWTGASESTSISMFIWLCAVALLTLPAAANFFAFGVR